MTEIERLAAAARQASYGRKIIPPWGVIDRFEQERWREVVRAVLQAMREPSKHAIESGQLAAEEAVEFTKDSYETYPVFSLSPMAIRAWEAMIDHILAGGE